VNGIGEQAAAMAGLEASDPGCVNEHGDSQMPWGARHAARPSPFRNVEGAEDRRGSHLGASASRPKGPQIPK